METLTTVALCLAAWLALALPLGLAVGRALAWCEAQTGEGER